ncbi:lysosomal alpha-mannosidase-like protein, partial [Leptotrombidium deliense]
VRQIISSVVEHLNESSPRRFIFVETCFFARWWKQQNNETKQKVHRLVEKGIFEWISGGWVMNDEAVPSYQHLVDQMTLGHRWLNRTFKECGQTKIGWQIDPFGHSKEYATILAEMGFDALFLGRIDYQDKLQREQTKTLEFMWDTSESQGADANLFTVILPNVYWPPNGFCWDVGCGDEEMSDANAVNKAKFIISLAKDQWKKYKSNNTLITMGNDFTHRDANKWFRNLDKLIEAINKLEKEEGVFAFHSTTGCYLKTLHNLSEEWPLMVGDDFFPYADKFNAYWSGYFTSRPAIKYLVFYVNTYLQAAKQLSVFTNMNQTLVDKLTPLQESMGILMHHDAIAGTEKQYVTEDYIRMLCRDFRNAEIVIEEALNRLTLNNNESSAVFFCHSLNTSECIATENISKNSQIIVSAYNSLAHDVNTYIKLPVKNHSFEVTTSNGSKIVSEVFPNHDFVNSLPGRNSSSNSTLVFPVTIGAFGIESFIITRIKKQEQNTTVSVSNATSITNGNITLSINNNTGLLSEISLNDNRKMNLSQSLFVYEAEGILSKDKPSGAYAFNPMTEKPYKISKNVEVKIIKGSLVEEIHQTFSSWASQVIRLYKNQHYVEFDWTVGPLPTDGMTDEGGLEIVTKFCTALQTNATFFTDSNGKESIKRIRHERRTWNMTNSEKVGSNYYPITNTISIIDEKQNLQLSVIPDRPQGGSSMKDGCLELMVHRRLLHDDGYGVVEPLNEKGIDKKGLVIRGRHWLLFDSINQTVKKLKETRKVVQNEPILVFRKSNKTDTTKNETNGYKSFSGLKAKLPRNINILSLEHWDDGRILLRLEHLFEQNEHSKCSKPKKVSLRQLFEPFTIEEVVETSLNGVQEKRKSQESRLKWKFAKSEPNFYRYQKSTSNDTSQASFSSELDPSSLNVTISAMQIRTFLMRVKFGKN